MVSVSCANVSLLFANNQGKSLQLTFGGCFSSICLHLLCVCVCVCVCVCIYILSLFVFSDEIIVSEQFEAVWRNDK